MEDSTFNMQPSGSHLALPEDCLIDRANRQQPTASDHVKDTMVQLFAGDCYASHMHMLRVANPKAAQALVRFALDVCSRGRGGAGRGGGCSTSGSLKNRTKRSFVKNENGGTCQRRALGVYTFDTSQ